MSSETAKEFHERMNRELRRAAGDSVTVSAEMPEEHRAINRWLRGMPAEDSEDD